MNNKKIDIIIPAYKAHTKIEPLLHSIAMQTIKDDIKVIIINDACPEGDYQEYVNKFKNYYDIEEIVLNKNGGPGSARQAGIDNSYNYYIIFADADDTFTSAYSLEYLKNGIEENPDAVCCVGGFLEHIKEGYRIPHLDDGTWVFGKIFKREFLDLYRIKFFPLRSNEDSSFMNFVIEYGTYSNPHGLLAINDFVYDWHKNDGDSITTVNNRQFSFDQCLCGMVEGSLLTLKQFKNQNIISKIKIENLFIKNLISLYINYNVILSNGPEFVEQAWYYIRKYYFEGLKLIEKEEINEIDYKEKIFMMLSYAHSQDGLLYKENVVECMTFKNFLNELKDSNFNPNEIKEIHKKLSDEIKQNNIKTGAVAADYYN